MLKILKEAICEDYEDFFIELECLEDKQLQTEIFKKIKISFGYNAKNIDELRLFGYRKLTLPSCKNKIMNILNELEKKNEK